MWSWYSHWHDNAQDGFRMFNVQLVDTGVCKTFFQHQLNRMPDFEDFGDTDDELLFNDADEDCLAS